MRSTVLILLAAVSLLFVHTVSAQNDEFAGFEDEFQAEVFDDLEVVRDDGEDDVVSHDVILNGGSDNVVGGFQRMIQVEFALKGPRNEHGEFIETINQIEALYWRDPAWDIFYKEGKFKVMTASSARINKGRPGVYEFRYSLAQIHFPGNDAYFIKGKDKTVSKDAVYEDAAFRKVTVTPINWEACLNDPTNFELLECRQIKYLQGLPCRSNSLQLKWQTECSEFSLRMHQIHDDAANIKAVDLSVSRVVNELDANGRQTGKFYITCEPKDPFRQYDRRLYGFYDFPKGGYVPRCSVCDRVGICGQNAECRDLGRGLYECVCVPGYEMRNGVCARSISTPHILLHFNDRGSRGYSVMRQCDTYEEEGYDIDVGNNPEDSISNYRVNTQYSRDLPKPILETDEFEVYYTLVDKQNREINTVTRRVVVTPVNRCDTACGEQCPQGTVCRWKNHNLDFTNAVNYPDDIECICPQPSTCLHPETHEWTKRKLREGYNVHYNREKLCYKESGYLSGTHCSDVAAPVMYWKEYADVVYTCRVCDHNFVDGEVSDPDCVFYDFHDQVEKPCAFTRGSKKIYVNETFKKETVLLIARDNAGNTVTKEIFVYHEIEDVSQHIYELIQFRNQMNSFQQSVQTIYSWFKTTLVALLVIFLLWLCFTEEGSFFFSCLCDKIKQPTRSWPAIQADVRVRRLMQERNG